LVPIGNILIYSVPHERLTVLRTLVTPSSV
jgi:hypothetical protein